MEDYQDSPMAVAPAAGNANRYVFYCFGRDALKEGVRLDERQAGAAKRVFLEELGRKMDKWGELGIKGVYLLDKTSGEGLKRHDGADAGESFDILVEIENPRDFQKVFWRRYSEAEREISERISQALFMEYAPYSFGLRPPHPVFPDFSRKPLIGDGAIKKEVGYVAISVRRGREAELREAVGANNALHVKSFIHLQASGEAHGDRSTVLAEVDLEKIGDTKEFLYDFGSRLAEAGIESGGDGKTFFVTGFL